MRGWTSVVDVFACCWCVLPGVLHCTFLEDFAFEGVLCIGRWGGLLDRCFDE